MSQKLSTYRENAIVHDLDFNVMQSFHIVDRVGKGAYGIVWKAIEKRNGRQVAIKKILNAFRGDSDAQRTYREITFLKYLRSHPNIVTLFAVYRAINDQDIYLVFEYMSMDLHQAIVTGTLSSYSQIKFIMYQLLKATKFLHSYNIVHRDLKPSNILLDELFRCKLADFGLARFVNESKIENKSHQPLTEYVATRWYRAPEILLGCPNYNKEVDMWSLGCILAEMVLWKPIFPGKSTLDQIVKICKSISANFIRDLPNSKYKMNQMIVPAAFYDARKSLKAILKEAPYDAFDLIRNLLVINPGKRLTAAQCLKHKFVSKLNYQKSDIKIGWGNRDVNDNESDTDSMHMRHLTVEEYKKKLYKSAINSRHDDYSGLKWRLSESHIPQMKNSSINLKKSLKLGK